MNIPLNIDWQQILLHMFNFVLLFAILYFLLYKPVKTFIDKRQAYYQQKDADINEKLEKASELEKEYNDRLSEIDEEIQRKQKMAKETLAADKAKYLQAAQDERNRIIQKAKTEAERIHEEMLRQTDAEMLQMITEAAEKIVFPDTDAAYDSFIDEIEGSDSDA